MDDLISRQVAIDALEREKSLVERPITETRWFDFGLRKAQDVLSKLPSAQPERKKGKWERHYCEDGNPDGWRCDKCDEWYYFGQTLPNFCPNCGAKMRGEQDG